MRHFIRELLKFLWIESTLIVMRSFYDNIHSFFVAIVNEMLLVNLLIFSDIVYTLGELCGPVCSHAMNATYVQF